MAARLVTLILLAFTLVATDRAGAEDKLSPAIRDVIEGPRFKHAHWGVLVVDLSTGEAIYQHNPDKLFAPASTTKLYSVATALGVLGADHRFRTPVYRRGDVDAAGVLAGDLILVASGDPTMGGRTNDKGEIAFTSHDHTYAGGNAPTELTEPNPLAGLDELARQVAAAGIKKVNGDVIIDDRLFEQASSTGSGPSRVTPIMINDNLIDVTITPSNPSSPAIVDWRPRAECLTVDAKVDTIEAGKPTKVTIARKDNELVVRGQIAADHRPVVNVEEVPDPAKWARTLLIEALERAKVEVTAETNADNAKDKLRERGSTEGLTQAALLTSPPFAENARLILKVSHNLHASTLPLLTATHGGKRTLADGLAIEHDYFERAKIGVDTISFGGAAGGANADFTTPRANVALLRFLVTRPDFPVYLRALPILGVDGTLSEAVAADSPARGKVEAKTGTLYWQNTMNDAYLLTSKALAGYLTAKSGRRLAISLVVNGVHMPSVEGRSEIGKVLGHLCEILYDEQ